MRACISPLDTLRMSRTASVKRVNSGVAGGTFMRL